MIDHVMVETAPRPAGHYSHAVRAGDLVFVSGQVPRSADGTYTPASVADETDLTLRNVAAIAAAFGVGLDAVVKMTVYLTSTDHFAEFDAAYTVHFPGPPPARTTVVAGLRSVQVELDAVLYVGRS